MRLHAALCLSTVIASHSVAAEAQSASQIVERHIKAIGGKKAVEQIVSTEVSGRVTSADGRTGVFTLRAVRPLLFSVALSWGDARWRTGFNGRASWEDDSSAGVRTLYGQAAAHVRAEAQHGNIRLVAPEKIVQLFLVGPGRVRDRPVMVIAALTSDATRRTMFFDADTYLL